MNYKLRIKKLKNNKEGFVILFAVTLSSILLAIAMGVSNVAVKEAKFGTSVRDSNDAFFAADTAIEYVLFRDKPPTSPYIPIPGTAQTWNEVRSALGVSGTNCAIVDITKDNRVAPFTTTSVVSRGYNIGDASCASSNPNRVEREIKINY